MLRYEIMTESEAMSERFQLLKEGIYDAVVAASQDTKSKKGSPMMDITLTVYDKEGKTHEIRDFLVLTRQMMWKVIHFAESAGILKEYEEGALCSKIAAGKRVLVKVATEEGREIPDDKLNGKPVGTRYFDKNKIEDYINATENNSRAFPNNQQVAWMNDDPIPI